jgi:transposase
LQKLQQRVAQGQLKRPEAIGAAAARALSRHHGERYYRWYLEKGRFVFQEHPVRLSREKQLEGKYVLVSSEQDLTAQEAVQQYKELMEVERGFRSLKDVLALRPIYHRWAKRVKAHIFVAALALLVQRLLERHLQRSGVQLSAEEALQAMETVRVVQFGLDGQAPRQGISTGSPRARQVIKALAIRQLRPPVPPGAETEVS